jgi:branched-chain amino acid transport system permease protein
VTHGASGFFGIPVTSVFGVQLSGFSAGYYTCLVLLTLTTLFVWRFSRTFAARAMLAVRFDDFAAESMGINAFFTRQLAMALSGVLAGFAGAILVATAVFVAPGNFNLLASFNIGLWVIIGGMASIPGAIAAGGLITLLTEEFRFLSHVSVGLLGVLVLIAVYTRGGVLSDLVADRVARRHGRRMTSEAPHA